MASEEEANIRVAVRVRPLNTREKDALVMPVVTCSGKNVRLTYGGGKKDASGKRAAPNEKSYQYDNVFGMYSTQSEVFNTMVAPSCDECLAGFNCTIFAYGQTGTGKTHTMEGCAEDPTERGIIPRSIHRIFESLEAKNCDFSVHVSYLEIYNEELNDLLGDVHADEASHTGKSRRGETKMSSTAKAAEERSKKLILCDSVKGVVCNNLTETACFSSEDVLACVEKGAKTRKVVATMMNAESSRSHSIFTIKVMIKEVTATGEHVRFGQLNLVDLAGSEDVQRSGAKGKALNEAKNINKSLLTLGRVINNLLEGSSHIPYRDSKLTRLLQESLGGRAKTTIIATLSPAEDSAEESNSTLDYAYRARNIKNKPVSNSTASKSTVLRECGAEMEEMRLMLQAQRDKAGTFLPTDKYEAMCREIEGSRAQLEECEGALNVLRDDLEAEKQRSIGLTEDLAFSKKTCAKLNEDLQTTTVDLSKTQEALTATSMELEASDAVVNAQKCTESALTEEAMSLDQSLATSEVNIDGLLQKVARAALDAEVKAQSATRFGEAALQCSASLSAQAKTMEAAVMSAGGEMESLLAQALEAAAAAQTRVKALSQEHDGTLQEAAQAHKAGVTSQAQAMEHEAKARGESVCAYLKSDAAAVAEAANTVAMASKAATEAMQQQRAALAALASQMAEAASEADAKTQSFVEAQNESITAARVAHGNTTQEALQSLSSQQAQLKAFAEEQRAKIGALQHDLSAQRAQAQSAVESALQEEQIKAAQRAEEASVDASAMQASVAAEADALMATVAAAIEALKSKHAEATHTVTAANTARTVTAASDLKESLTQTMADNGEAASALEAKAAGALTEGMSTYESSASRAMSTSVATMEGMDSALGQSSDCLKASTCAFGENLTQSLRDQASQSASSISDIDTLAVTTTTEMSTLNEAHASHAATHAANTEMQLVEAATAMEVALQAASGFESSGNELQTNVSTLCEKRASALEVMLEEQATSVKQEATAMRTVVGAHGSSVLEVATKTAFEAHAAGVTDLDSALEAHVKEVQTELTRTGATPVKVAFPHPEELSKTNDHAAIKQEARKMSKRAYASVAAAILGAGGNGEEEVAEASRSSKKRDSSESAVSMDPENAPPSARGKIARGDSVGDVVRNPLGNAN